MTVLQKELILKESLVMEQEHPEYFEALNDLVREMAYRSIPRIPVMPNLPFHDTLKILLDMLERGGTMTLTKAMSTENIYQTSDLAAFFGVSQTAINNWIDEGRFGEWVDGNWVPFRRVKKGSHAHVRESLLWRSATGETMPVVEVVRAYEAQFPPVQVNYSLDDHLQSVNNKIARFEEKYGSYSELVRKTERNSREDRDLDIWRLLLSELGGKI